MTCHGYFGFVDTCLTAYNSTVYSLSLKGQGGEEGLEGALVSGEGGLVEDRRTPPGP